MKPGWEGGAYNLGIWSRLFGNRAATKGDRSAMPVTGGNSVTGTPLIIYTSST